MAKHILLWLSLIWSCTAVIGTPVIEDTPIVCNIGEGTQVETKLACINCTTDATGFEVSLMSISPSSPCGKCFTIIEKDPLEGYCLYFLASQGDLKQQSADRYTIRIQCEDSNGDKVQDNIDVRVMPNEAPTFKLNSATCKKDPFPVDGAAGEVIYDEVLGVDNENDSLYYSMTTTPVTDNYEIGVGDGIIRSTNLLKFGCHPKIAFHISVKDAMHSTSSSKTIECNFDTLSSPLLTNVNKILKVPEDFAVGNRIILLYPSFNPKISYQFSTKPEEAFAMFNFDKRRIVLAAPLNYENNKLRSINITIVPDNGYCKTVPHFLQIEVTDVNDLPIFGPEHLYEEVYEGVIKFTPNFKLTDEDELINGQVAHYYSIKSGNSKNIFHMNPVTGEIFTVIEYDVDKGAMPKDVTLVIQVNDTKGPDVATATVHLKILDSNDNPPVFRLTTRTFSVTECEQIGRNLGTLNADDKIDSNFNTNNETYIEETSNGRITVTSGGKIYLTGTIAAGDVSILTVYAWDKGVHPKRLYSPIPATVKVRSFPCPTTQPVVVVVGNGNGNGGGNNNNNNGNGNAATIPTTTTTTPTTTTTEAVTIAIGICTGFFCDPAAILGIIAGAIGGLALLAGLAYCLSKKCRKTPEQQSKAKFDKETKREEKARQKQDKKNQKNLNKKPTAGGFNFWSSSV